MTQPLYLAKGSPLPAEAAYVSLSMSSLSSSSGASGADDCYDPSSFTATLKHISSILIDT